MGELAITRAFGDKSFKMGIKAMLEEEADEIARGLNESDQAKDLTAPLVSAEPEIASMVSWHRGHRIFVWFGIASIVLTFFFGCRC